jgi:crotonobetainyl-CoA:carnitine CoA-transferase CaiB-like acyl-CoA transferase
VGAVVSQTLADYGADVVLVEPPGGSRLRSRASFPMLGRGKRSVVADLRTTGGVELIHSLADGADVLIETFRPGVADRHGLGYDALSSRNPALVYASITGFGRRGPWANLKGYEGVVAALVGLNGAYRAMTSAGHPPFVAVPWCSHAASHTALHGILAALLERQQSGTGQWVESNLLQSVTIHEGASSSWYGHLVTTRWPEAFVTAAPLAHHFLFRLLVAQTKDGRWLQFAQNRPHLFEAFMRALGLEWMLTDPKWEGIPMLEDAEQRAELLHRMLAGVSDRTLGEWQDIFEEHRDVFAELYRTGPEVLDHPQLVHDGSVVEVTDPERGAVRQPGPQFELGGTPATLRGPAPTLGDESGDAWSTRAGRDVGAPAVGAPVLEGVTVLELAVQYAAPYGATLLADLGARVIKVEQLEGDSIRRQRPQFPEVGAGKPLQGKESVAVDIHTPEGLEILHQLAGRVDAVVDGYRAGVAERGGFDYDTLRGFNPDLVYVSAPGYGVSGPCADRAAFAPSFGAAAGIASAQLGGTDDVATVDFDELLARSATLRSASASSYGSADGIGALGVATSLLLGLIARTNGSGGQHVVSTMLLSAAHAMADSVVSYPGRPDAMSPGPDLRGPGALYRIYDASDGWVFLAAPQEKEWRTLVDALAPHVDLVDPRFATAADRAANDGVLADVLSRMFVERSRHEWQRDLSAADVACVAVTTDPPEVLLMSDEVGRAAGYITDVRHPLFDVHPRLAPVVAFSRSTTTARGAELCGSATDAVLGELGYTPVEIDDLRAHGVIGPI